MTGAKNAGKVVAVPVGMTLQPLNIKLADAQFFELKKYTALQIAGAFGIKPNQLNNYEKSSYANSETQQLAFLIDTMAYRLNQYEQEINYKCLTPEEQKNGFFFKFNEKALLRTDAKTQMANIVSAVTNGLYTVNEGRELLDLAYVDGGDVNMVNGTYTPITQIGAAYGIVSAVTNGLYTVNEGRELLDLAYVDGGDVNMVNGTYTPITQIGAAYGLNNNPDGGGEGNTD